MQTRERRNLLIGGAAGQGLGSAGHLLAHTLVRCGYAIVVTQSYQSRIRGGHNTFAIRVSPRQIAAPQESVDLLIALDADTVRLHRDELVPAGLILAAEAAGGDLSTLAIPFADLGGKPLANFAVLGVTAAILGIDPEQIVSTVAAAQRKRPALAERASAATRNAFVWAQRQPVVRANASGLRLPPLGRRASGRHAAAPSVRPDAPPQRVMMNGNQAIALGAISAGARFCAFYPMTPATSVNLTLISLAERMGLVVEQAEDEIAAINMAIGASFAGAPSLVATSGGGFALMTEAVSLAGMTETPLVIVVAQRPGPATGLPTRTEQADLEFVLHAGHGEFPRAIFAPAGVEDCFALTRQAFDLAERHQGPIFVLTDQYLADSYRAVVPFAVRELPAVRPGTDSAARPSADPIPPAAADAESLDAARAAPYRRHAFSDTGVSPRLLPGRSEQLVVTDSDEHTTDGHLTEDLVVRRQMVEKRLRKERGIRSEVLPPDWVGDDRPDLLLVGWGSTGGAVREAVAGLRAQGRRAASLHFTQVWPLEPEQFAHRLEAATTVVAVEGNATGQFARLIRRECGFEIPRRLQRYDGLPMTPEYILRSLGTGD